MAESPRSDQAEEEAFRGLSPEPLSIEARLEMAQAENRRLQQERDLRELEARNDQLRNPGLSPIVVAPTSGTNPIAVQPIKAKTLRPEKMRAYKGTSEGEHLRWFRDVGIQFITSPEYFTTDLAKIGHCMLALEGDPADQWHAYVSENGLTGTTFEFFKNFLLNILSDPANRRLLAYERWEQAKQRTDQKVTVFKAYLEELESHLPPFTEEHRANIFLAKLKGDLKNKILSTGNVPKQRDEILALAIMQERIMERGRPSSGSHSHSGPGSNNSGGKPKGKPLEPRGTAPKGNNAKPAQPNKEGGNGKKRKSGDFNPEHKDDTCFHCGKQGHWAPECPDKDKPATYVAAVTTKNDQAPPAPPKRSKKSKE